MLDSTPSISPPFLYKTIFLFYFGLHPLCPHPHTHKRNWIRCLLVLVLVGTVGQRQ
uniref:Uncharacterized protein n=1 Tax=Zea mays TaxID=4577 RepID=C4J321_MAIZE|nr:unknown [Zea mays]